MADFAIDIEINAKKTETGAAEAKRAIKSVGDEAEKLEKKARKSIAGVDLSGLKTQLKQAGDMVRNFGSAVSGAGRSLTVGLTAPLAALGTFGVKSALELDKVRTKITALVGDGEKANAKMAELRNLADSSVGVTRQAALETFAQLKGVGGIADESINKIIASMGKLNAAFDVEDSAGFMRNLTQIFSQGFEIADIKEAIGRVPIFKQLLEQAFGTSDGEKLKALKEAGKLTLDNFLGGISDAINNDPRTGKIGENLSTKLAKGMEKINNALAPLGDVILNAVVPVFETLTPYIQQLGAWFEKASPTVKTFVVAIAGIAAAAGPVLIVLGSLITAVGGIITAVGTIAGAVTAVGGLGPALLVVIGVILQFGAVFLIVGAQIAALYLAWQTNFGGIRDLTAQVVEFLKSAWDDAMSQIADITATVTAEVSKFWEENGGDIMQALQSVSDFIKSTWQSVVAFWRANSGAIQQVTSAVWNVIKTVVVTAVRIISNVIKLVAAVINGDWSKAWEATKEILKAAISAWVQYVGNVGTLLIGAIRLALNAVWSLRGWILDQSLKLGVAIVQGIINGIGSLASSVWEKGKSLVSGIFDSMRSTAETHSPSRVTTEIGQFIGEGLAVGMDNRVERVKRSAKKLADETIKQLKDAVAEFNKLAGASPGQVARIQQANEFSDATSAQQEIIRLRKELGVNKNLSLPGGPQATQNELKDLQARKKAVDDLDAAAEQLTQELIRQQEALEQRQDTIRNSGAAELLNLQQEINLTGVSNELDRQRITNNFDILRLREQMANDGFAEDQIEETVKIAKAEQNRRFELEKILAVRKQVAAATALGKDLDDELESLRSGNVELSKYEEVLRKIGADLKLISPEQKDFLLNKAKEIDVFREAAKAQEEAQRAFDDLYNNIRDGLQVLADEGFGGFFRSVMRKFKSWLLDMAAEWLTSKFFKSFFQGQGVSGTGAVGGAIGGGQQTTGGIGGFLQNLFGGGRGQGPGGTPVFNPNARSLVAGNGSLDGIDIGNGGFNPRTGTYSSGGGVFGGGAFGKGNLAGTLGGIGAGASVIGGMIGGRVGGFISNIGMGVALGAQIGSIIPGVGTVVGAVVGGAVGFISSLFGGDPKRKRDKKEKIPQLNKGFTDSMAELRQLVADVRTLRVSPDSALARATELRAAIASGFGIEFESKKYRKQAQTMIAARLREADALIEELRSVSEVARAAGERERRILPEFASGVFMSRGFMQQFAEFKRRNGVLTGTWTGRDTLPSMLAKGEMVLNPEQQDRVIRNARMDPFRNAGIPGYAGGGMAGSGQAGPQPIVVSSGDISVQVFVEQDSTGLWTATAKSPSGQKVLVDVIQEKFRNDEMKLKRR